MKKILALWMALCLFALTAKTQSFVDEDFDQTGKMLFNVFANFHADVSGDEVNNTAFEVQRAYLGYAHNFNEKLTGQVILDAGLNNVNQYGVFLKIAGLTWRPTDKLTINGGMISPNQFKTQERFWGYRYLYKTFQDEYKFGHSSDLGMTAEYKFNKYIWVDLGFFNGEGFKNVVIDYGDFKGSASVTIHPIEKIEIRLYYDIMNNKDTILPSEFRQNQSTFASFIGYRVTDKFRVAGEYNYQKQHKNVKDHNLFGYSFYATYIFNNRLEVFGRTDILMSNKLEGETENWDYKRNGVGVVGGLQYKPAKGLSLALNYRHVFPDIPNGAPTPPSSSFIFFNVEFKFN